MSPSLRVTALLLCIGGLACSRQPRLAPAQANAGIDSLNARVADAYRRRDPQAYGAVYTDSGVFEWPATNTVRGRGELASMAQSIWAAEKDVSLRLDVATRRVATDHATEFGAFQQSWSDSSGVRRTEFGRYVTYLVRLGDGSWRIDRFLGFEDSTRTISGR